MPNSKKSSDPADPEHDPGQREEEGGSSNNEVGPGPGPPPVPPVQRRDENSLSFRHFLNPQSDVVPTPFSRQQQRIARGANSASLDLVETPSTLPDFVQDHMLAESQQEQGGPSTSSSNNPSGMRIQSSNSLDISLSSSGSGNGHHQVQNPNNNSRILSSKSSNSSRRSLESSIRARLANIGGGDSISSSSSSIGNQGPVTLPDFLSDGPMLCDEGSAAEPSSDVTNERIVQLEREIYQQSRALESLQGALRVSEEKLEEANTRANYAEAKIAKLKSDMNSMKKKMLTEPGTSTNCGQNGEVANTNSESLINVNEVMDIARTSENLLRKLMEQVELLKSVSVSDSSKTDTEKPSSSKKLPKK